MVVVAVGVGVADKTEEEFNFVDELDKPMILPPKFILFSLLKFFRFPLRFGIKFCSLVFSSTVLFSNLDVEVEA